MLYPTILERTDAFYTGSIAIDEDQYMMEKNKQLKKSISKQLHNEEAVSENIGKINNLFNK